MPAVLMERKGAPRSRRLSRLLAVGAAVVATILAVIIAATVLGGGNRDGGGTRKVSVKPDGEVSGVGWVLADTASVVSTTGRQTYMSVRVSHTSAAASSPTLRSNFDGSGGGDAKVIRCSARSADWSVPVGQSQTVSFSGQACWL